MVGQVLYSAHHEPDPAFPVESGEFSHGYRVIQLQRSGERGVLARCYTQAELRAAEAEYGPLSGWGTLDGGLAAPTFNPRWQRLPEEKTLIPLRFVKRPWLWGWMPR